MIPARPIFVGEGESHDMMEVIPKSVTLNPISNVFYPRTNLRPNHTLFKEVHIKPYEEREEVTELIERVPRGYASLEELYQILKDHIESVWDPTKLHLIGHSSGVDSRIISKAIMELKDKHGDEWYGDTVFIENMGESSLFLQIAAVMGFKGLAYGSSLDPQEFNEEYIDFNTQYSKFNGIVAFPLNQWMDGYTHLGISSDNVQGFTGYGANETQQKAVRRKMGYRWYFDWSYSLQLTLWKYIGGDWEHPFLEWDFLHALTNSDAKKVDRVNEQMSRLVTPEINPIPHIHGKEVAAMGYRVISEPMMKRCYDEYKASWFGKLFDVAPNPKVDYTEWWWHYNAASWCEHLIETGHEIKTQ